MLFDPISIRLIISKLIFNQLNSCDLENTKYRIKGVLEIDSPVHRVGLRLKTEDKAVDLLD